MGTQCSTAYDTMRDMPDHDVARRTFLRGVTAATALSYSRVLGANDRVQMALIGCGERGRSDLGNFVKLGVDVVALSDSGTRNWITPSRSGPTPAHSASIARRSI